MTIIINIYVYILSLSYIYFGPEISFNLFLLLHALITMRQFPEFDLFYPYNNEKKPIPDSAPASFVLVD